MLKFQRSKLIQLCVWEKSNQVLRNLMKKILFDTLFQNFWHKEYNACDQF